MTDERREMDYRFSLANERTFLAWIRTSLALVAGGLFAAKALDFDHEIWRWVVAAPPIVAGAALAFDARGRWRRYEEAMLDQRPLPDQRGVTLLGVGLAVYAIVALLISVLEG
jgi:putative membrane protein